MARLHFDVWPDTAPATGTGLGELTLAYKKRVTVQHNAFGSGEFTINRNDAAMVALAQTGYLVRVRTAEGGPFEWDDERYFFAFWIDAGKDSPVSDDQAAEEWQRGGRGIGAVIKRWKLYPGTFISGAAGARTDDNWHWWNDQYGDIFRRLFLEDAARPIPTMPWVTYDFTGTLDSLGSPWTTFDGAYELAAGIDGEAYESSLQDQGLECRMTPAFVQQASEDFSSVLDVSDVVIFRDGINIREGADRDVHSSPASSRMLVKGAQDPATGRTVWQEVTDSQTATLEASGFGRREGFIEYGDSPSPTVLIRAGRQALAGLRAHKDGPVSVGVTHGTDTPTDGIPLHYEPFVDYREGSWVTLDVAGEYSMSRKKVVGITLTETDEGEDEVLEDAGLPGGYEVTLDLDGTPFDPVDSLIASASPAGGQDGGCKCLELDDCQGRHSTLPVIEGHAAEAGFNAGVNIAVPSGLTRSGLVAFFVSSGDVTAVEYRKSPIAFPGAGVAMTRIGSPFYEYGDPPGVQHTAWLLLSPDPTVLDPYSRIHASITGGAGPQGAAVYLLSDLDQLSPVRDSATAATATDGGPTVSTAIGGQGLLVLTAVGWTERWDATCYGLPDDPQTLDDTAIGTSSFGLPGTSIQTGNAIDVTRVGWHDLPDLSCGAGPGWPFHGSGLVAVALAGPTTAPDLPEDCHLVSEQTFGQDANVGDSDLAARADHTHGTPELDGVGTVPTEGPVADVGDSLVVTTAPSGSGANDGIAHFGHPPADHVDYDNTASGLLADNVQDAIDEVLAKGGRTFAFFAGG